MLNPMGASGAGRVHVAVCVPARDEQATLPALIGALRDQAGALDLTLCLFLDGCRDRSAAVAAASAGGLPLRIRQDDCTREANAGRARGRAMALGLDALGGDDSGRILTTDADSVPARDWVASMVAALDEVEVVAGLIERAGPADPLQDRIEAYCERLYAYRRAVDPLPWEPHAGHHYTGGANLGFRAEAYRGLGGFAPRPWGEDAVLVDEAGRAGLRVRRDRTAVVRTSPRREGRAAGGLAATLRQLDAAGEQGIGLARPTAAAWQYRRHALARAAFPLLPGRGAAAEFGATIGLTADHVIGVARDCPNAEAFAMRIVPAAPDAHERVTLAEAERLLASLEAARLERAA